MVVFSTNVVDIGNEAELFKEEKMMILFGKEAPDALAEYCYNIEVNTTSDEIQKDMYLKFDNQAYKITSVGNVVRKNLDLLGHITIKFDGSTQPELPGTLYVEDKELPQMKIGTKVVIE